jgi:hypothetical protein
MVTVRLVSILVLGAVDRSFAALFRCLCLSRFVLGAALESWDFLASPVVGVIFSPTKGFTGMSDSAERESSFTEQAR